MNKKDLKAFFRYDGNGRVVPGSLILQRNKPKVGNWQQTNAYECCDPSCLPLIYGEDYIIEDIQPYAPGQAVIIVLVNPEANFSVQGALYDCDGKLIAVSNVLDTLFPGENFWIVPESELFSSCSIKFRRICFNGNAHSDWSEPQIGRAHV